MSETGLTRATKLPSEIIPFSRPLKDHQKRALDRFAFQPECALFWEMGTMKTTTAIAILRAKFNLKRAVTKTLVIAPVATLYGWRDEFYTSAPKAVADHVIVPYKKIGKVKYKGAERAKLIESTDKRIVIINPDSLDNDEVVHSLQKFAPENVIVDEAHMFKSHALFTGNGSKKTPTRLNKLSSIASKSENRTILTGTPILNGYLDIWSQFLLLDNGATFGTNFYLFREKYFRDKNVGFKNKQTYFPLWVPKEGIEDEVSAMIERKASRLKKTECLDLPPEVFETHCVELGDEQRAAYDEMADELVTEVSGGTCAATNALSKVNYLLQIIAGHVPVKYDGDYDSVLRYFKKNPRLELLCDLLSTNTKSSKVIVWTGYQATYPKLREAFRSLGIEWAELVGQTKDRQAELDRFAKDDKCRVMMSHPAAGGVGVNGMQVADRDFYYSRSFNLGHRLQSLARNHRGGSEIHASITHNDIVAHGTYDDLVLASLLRKENFSENILARIRS